MHESGSSYNDEKEIWEDCQFILGYWNLGARVNCICPSFIDTPGVRKLTPKDEDPDKFVESIGRSIPMCRMGTTEDVGKLVLFLVSDESNYITGTHIVIDGGNILQEPFSGPYIPK